MGRPNESTTVLSGYIGYAARPEPDWTLPANRLRWAQNVWVGTQHGVAQRRMGSEALSLPVSLDGEDLQGLLAFRPSGSATRLITKIIGTNTSWYVQDSPNSTAWTAETLPTIFQVDLFPREAVTLNNKVFFGWASSADTRVRVYDIAASSVRAAGFATPAAPTGANSGAGAYAATLRYYRVRYTTQATGVTVRRSEPSASLTFTPSGAGTHVVVTKPAALSEGETHWELEVSLDNANWYILATTAVATTTYNDSAATSTYSSGVVSEDVGDRLPLPACQCVAVDRDRLLLGGEATLGSRLWFTPVLGTTDIADEECVQTDNYIDIDAEDEDRITAILGPVDDAMYVFKYRSVHRLARTGVAAAPYAVTKVLDGIGVESSMYVILHRQAFYLFTRFGIYRFAGGVLERLDADLFAEGKHADQPRPLLSRVAFYKPRNVILFGNHAYSLETGGWTYQTWDGLNLDTWAVSEGGDAVHFGSLVAVRSQGGAGGACYIDASGDVEADGTSVRGAVWFPRVRLAGAGREWQPTRVRVWGNVNTAAGRLTVQTYRDRLDIGPTTLIAGDTALMTQARVTLDTYLSGKDAALTDPQHLGAGPTDALGVVITNLSGDTTAPWSLNALELSWLPAGPSL